VSLREFLRELHSRSAIDLNRMDGIEDRTVWPVVIGKVGAWALSWVDGAILVGDE
jgi:hypothetical protein